MNAMCSAKKTCLNERTLICKVVYSFLSMYVTLDTKTQPSRGRQHRGVIDFVSAKRREVNKKVSNRQK